MWNAPYFITDDLEVTWWVATEDLVEIRRETTEAMNKAFSWELPIRRIWLEEWIHFFREIKKPNEFVISADGWIYISNPDIAYDSTRMFPNERSILEDKKSYTIMTRDGKPLSSQSAITIPEDRRNDVWLYDDGLFSGDTLRAILSNLPNGITQYKINVLLNFSSENKLGGISINSYYQWESLDWIDERDFFYGVMNSGASINSNWVISGVPYISSPDMASQKASIPLSASKKFCLTMLWVNKKLWSLIDENALLWNIPRVAHLLSRYPSNMSMQDLLQAEINRIESNF